MNKSLTQNNDLDRSVPNNNSSAYAFDMVIGSKYSSHCLWWGHETTVCAVCLIISLLTDTKPNPPLLREQGTCFYALCHHKM